MMDTAQQFWAFLGEYARAAGDILADNSFATEWKTGGLYGLMRDMGGMAGASMALLAGWFTYRAAMIPVKQAAQERSANVRDSLMVLHHYAGNLERVAVRLANFFEKSRSGLAEPLPVESVNLEIRRALQEIDSPPGTKEVEIALARLTIQLRYIGRSCTQSETVLRTELAKIYEAIEGLDFVQWYDSQSLLIAATSATFSAQQCQGMAWIAQGQASKPPN